MTQNVLFSDITQKVTQITLEMIKWWWLGEQLYDINIMMIFYNCDDEYSGDHDDDNDDDDEDDEDDCDDDNDIDDVEVDGDNYDAHNNDAYFDNDDDNDHNYYHHKGTKALPFDERNC